MSSELLSLSIVSAEDVQITLYDAAGLKQKVRVKHDRDAGRTRWAEQDAGVGHVIADVPPGLYRVQLDRCGFVREHVIDHDPPEELQLAGPELESPAPIEIARGSEAHAHLARRLSAPGNESLPALGDGARDARLCVFVRRMSRATPGEAFPSEPISLHDATGRLLRQLVDDTGDPPSDPETGFRALSCRIAPGTYHLCVGRTRRDLAITIPAGRAAHVFLADHGTISLRNARVYLPLADAPFDPRSDIARAMESVLWSLGRQLGELPPIAERLLSRVDQDLSFGIACAHVVRRQQERDRATRDEIVRQRERDRVKLAEIERRQGREPSRPGSTARQQERDRSDVEDIERRRVRDRAALDEIEGRESRNRASLDAIMRSLAPHAAALPDIAILSGACDGAAIPPLFRASLVQALEDQVAVSAHSALEHATKTGHDDSVWCTWSPLWWDEQWIEPTIEQLKSRRGDSAMTAGQIAEATRLPVTIVLQAIASIDAGLPRIAGRPVAIDQLEVPGYTVLEVAGRSGRGTVFRARRNRGGGDVAIEIVPTASRDAAVRTVREIRAARWLRHEHLVRFEDCGVLPDGSGVWLEMELCAESLFDRVAALGRPMQPDEACRLVLQAIEALEYLHARGIAHGHIHPGSLLVRQDGTIALGPPWPACDREAMASMIATDTAGAAMRFMAPERVLDPTSASPASDVWSMTATLYFLLTLDLPRERYTDQSEIEAVRHNGSVPIARHLRGVPAPLATCLERGLSAHLGPPAGVERRPETLVSRTARRFRDGAELHDALSTAVDPTRAASRATELHDELVREDPGHATTIRNLFLRMTLVAGGEVVRRWVRRDDLTYESAAENLRVDAVLQRFQAAGLLITRRHGGHAGPSELVEPANDDFVADWAPIRRWHHALDAVPGTRELLAGLEQALHTSRDEQRASLSPVVRSSARLARLIRHEGRFMYNKREEQLLRRSRGQAFARLAVYVTGAVLAFAFAIVSWQRWAAVAEAKAASARQVLAGALQEAGRQQVLSGRAFRALPYLAAAREAGGDDDVAPALRMLFRAASARLGTASPLVHDDSVRRAVFSPDGSRIVTASRDGTARLWNATTGAELVKLEHNGAVVSAAFSPDGAWIVTASEDRTARIWDAATGRPRGSPLEHEDFVESARFSPDGKRVVTASLDHTARIWNAATGAREQVLAHRDAVWSAVFSPDGARVVTASRDHTARIWDVATGTAVGRPLAHRDAVWSAVFSPDGAHVVTASQDATARVWLAATGAAISPPLEHRDGVSGAAFDAGGKRVVTASYDGTARVWDAATGAPVTPWLEHQGSVTGAAFSPDGARVVTACSDGNARIWDAGTGQLFLPLLEHTGPVTSAVFDSRGARVVTASFDGTARIWDARGDRPAVPLEQDVAVRAAAFSPDGARMVTVGDDANARLWDTATGKLVRLFVHDAPVRTAAFSPDGAWIVTTSDDRTMRIWDARNRGMRTAPLVLPGRPTSAVFSPDGSQIVTASDEDRGHPGDMLQIWNAGTGAHVSLALEYPGRIVGAWASRDGTRLLTLNRDRTARIWSTASGRPIASLDQAGVTDAAFSPDGKQVVTANDDQTARVWDAATGAKIGPPLMHQERVLSAAFSPDGTRILTVSADRTARVWDAITGKLLTAPLLHGAEIAGAAFTTDGTRIVTADRRDVRSWDVSLDERSPQDWSEVAKQGPYGLNHAALVLRSPACRLSRGWDPCLSGAPAEGGATQDAGQAADTFLGRALGLGEVDLRTFDGSRFDEPGRPR